MNLNIQIDCLYFNFLLILEFFCEEINKYSFIISLLKEI